MKNFEVVTAEILLKALKMNNTMLKYCSETSNNNDIYIIENTTICRLAKKLFNLNSIHDEYIKIELEKIVG